MMMMILMVKIIENLNHHRHHNLVGVRQMVFFVSPVSRHFPYSRDFVFSPLFWTLLEKVGRLEGGPGVNVYL